MPWIADPLIVNRQVRVGIQLLGLPGAHDWPQLSRGKRLESICTDPVPPVPCRVWMWKVGQIWSNITDYTLIFHIFPFSFIFLKE